MHNLFLCWSWQEHFKHTLMTSLGFMFFVSVNFKLNLFPRHLHWHVWEALRSNKQEMKKADCLKALLSAKWSAISRPLLVWICHHAFIIYQTMSPFTVTSILRHKLSLFVAQYVCQRKNDKATILLNGYRIRIDLGGAAHVSRLEACDRALRGWQ